MTTPLTITSLSQGNLRELPKSDSDYWDRLQERPQNEALSFRHLLKVEWPRWPLRRRADHP